MASQMASRPNASIFSTAVGDLASAGAAGLRVLAGFLSLMGNVESGDGGQRLDDLEHAHAGLAVALAAEQLLGVGAVGEQDAHVVEPGRVVQACEDDGALRHDGAEDAAAVLLSLGVHIRCLWKPRARGGSATGCAA